jgi:hypothetical protein
VAEFGRAGGEDEDFFIRAMRAGASCAVATDSVVNKECDEARVSFAAALGRSFHWGRTAMHVTDVHAGRVAARRRRAKALRRLLVGIALLPTTLGSKDRLMAHVYGLSKRQGMVLSSTSGFSSGGAEKGAPERSGA